MDLIMKDALPALPPDHQALTEGQFTWKITNWRELSGNRVVGPTFQVGDFKWNILLFPHGNSTNSLAVYLEPHPVEPKDRWHVCAQFTVGISHPDKPQTHKVSFSSHRFSEDETDWGFSQLCDLRQLYSTFLSENRVTISVCVRIIDDYTGVLWHNFLNYDSKAETGFVGINNQGATCYLNSLIQSYFSTNAFRKAVYDIPTDKSDNADVALALQSIFYQLQTSPEPVDTLGLTAAFGWDTIDAFTQHDVQELNRILMDRLEGKMKGTAIEGVLNNIFVGKMKSFIRCVNVDFESARIEDFWDVQLNVKGMGNLTNSFINYNELEMMDGENQYAAEGLGLQDAEKGVVFQQLPPVLHLQLKRFEYDFNYDRLIKLHDRYEYPLEVDLKPFLDSECEMASEDCRYQLHGVLVHDGDVSAGHYYALIRPGLEDEWFRFDDDKVWKATQHQVFEANFGIGLKSQAEINHLSRAEYIEYQNRKLTSAYMLVYIRCSKAEEILQPVDDSSVPAHVRDQVSQDLEAIEQRRRDVEFRQSHMEVKVITNSTFCHYEGFDLAPDPSSKYLFAEDLVDPKAFPLSVTLKRTDPFSMVHDFLKAEGLQNFRLWGTTQRSNHTNRIDCRVGDEDVSIEQMASRMTHRDGEMWLFAEESPSPKDFSPESDDIFLHIKYFDGETIRGITQAVVCGWDPVKSILPQVSKWVAHDLVICEEVKSDDIENVSLERTFNQCEIQTGDILCIARAQDFKAMKKRYEFLQTRIHLHFRPLAALPEEDEEYGDSKRQKFESETKEFSFWLPLRTPYAELASRVGSEVGVDPAYLRLFGVAFTEQRIPLAHTSDLQTLFQRPVSQSQVINFEYEVLSITLEQLDSMIHLKTFWLGETVTHQTLHEFLLPKTDTVSDLVDRLEVQLKPDQLKSDIVVWSGVNHVFHSLLYAEHSISALGPKEQIYAGYYPDVAKALRCYQYPTPDDETDSQKPILCFQFHKDLRRLHGSPFIFILVKDEPFGETKLRLQRLLGLGDKEFHKARIALYSKHSDVQPEYVADDDAVLFNEASQDDHLCVDHPDRFGGKFSSERGISIKM